MASLNLSATTTPNVARQETLGTATHCRLVTLPTAMAGVKGGGLDVSVYPLTTAAYWVSPDETQPAEDAIYAGTKLGYLPANTWTTIPWDMTRGDPASVALLSGAASQVVFIVVSPSREPA